MKTRFQRKDTDVQRGIGILRRLCSPTAQGRVWQLSRTLVLERRVAWLAFTAATLALTVSCKSNYEHRQKQYSLGTNGTLTVTFDSKQRPLELQQTYSDGRLKLKALIAYGSRDIQRFRVFDSAGNRVSETIFTENADSHTGRDTETPSPGWEIIYNSSWSGLPGDVHRDTSWLCGKDVLYRVRQVWSNDRSRVDYEVTGSTGVILFTNTYSD